MQIQVYKDERYPDYGLSKSGTYDLVEVSEEFFAEYERVESLYRDMQRKLEELYHKCR